MFLSGAKKLAAGRFAWLGTSKFVQLNIKHITSYAAMTSQASQEISLLLTGSCAAVSASKLRFAVVTLQVLLKESYLLGGNCWMLSRICQEET